MSEAIIAEEETKASTIELNRAARDELQNRLFQEAARGEEIKARVARLTIELAEAEDSLAAWKKRLPELTELFNKMNELNGTISQQLADRATAI